MQVTRIKEGDSARGLIGCIHVPAGLAVCGSCECYRAEGRTVRNEWDQPEFRCSECEQEFMDAHDYHVGRFDSDPAYRRHCCTQVPSLGIAA